MNLMRKIYRKIPLRIRKLIKKILKKGKKINVLSKDKFIKKLLKYDVISFDIFDTLITRSIYEPDDIFKIMDKKCKDLDLKDTFINMRKNAENSARQRFNKDVNINEIYEEFGLIYDLDKSTINKIKKIELDTELNLIYPRFDMIDILKELISKNKKVVLTSDMYLDNDTILKLLKKCGYEKGIHFEEFYLSNDMNLRKDTQTMWLYLKDVYNNNKFIHVGDNISSDYEIPKKLGIDAIHIDNSRDLFKKTNYFYSMSSYIENRSISDSLFLGYIINEQIFNSPFSLKINSLEIMSKVFIAPMMFELVKYIDINTKENDQLLFLAREGYNLEKLYSDYCKIFEKLEKKHYYFLASRKAAMGTTIQNEKDIKESINRDYHGTIKNFLKSVYDVNYDGDNFSIVLPDDLEKVFGVVQMYAKEIIDKSMEYKKNYIDYINSVLDKQDNMVLIDLGYSGTIQYHLSKMLNKTLMGIYLTNSSSVKKYQKNSKLLFAYDINDNKMYEKIYHYSLILEYFLSAPFGQLQYFSKKNKKIIPVYNDEIVDDKKKDNIIKMYKFVIDYFNRFKEFNDIYELNITKELICTNYISLIESNIISHSVKDEFDFFDSFSSDESKNVFKIISRY